MGPQRTLVKQRRPAAGKEVAKLPEGVVISSRGNSASVLVDGVFVLFMVTVAEAEAYVVSLRETESPGAPAL